MASPFTRRSFLGVSLGAAAAATLAACSSASPGGRSSVAPSYGASIRMSLFGTADRQKRLQQVFALYTAKFGGAVDAQVVANASYAEKLATEVAGGAAADVISLFHNLVADYARRDVLADLNQWSDVVSTSDFDQAAIASGVINDKRVALPLGDNAYAAFYDKGKLDSLGIGVPEPGHTWDQFVTFAHDVTKKAGGGYWGTLDASGDFNLFEVWLRQRGAALYTDQGQLGFTAAQLTDWYELWAQLRKDGVAPPAGVTAEATAGGFGTQPLVTGKATNFFIFGNVFKPFQSLTKSELAITTPPMDKTSESGLFVRASNWMAAYSRGKNVDDAVNLINFILNDEEAAKTLGAEFGAPANTKLRDAMTWEGQDKAFIDYVNLVSKTYARPVASLAVEFPTGSPKVQAAFLTSSQTVAANNDTADGAAKFISQAEGFLQ